MSPVCFETASQASYLPLDATEERGQCQDSDMNSSVKKVLQLCVTQGLEKLPGVIGVSDLSAAAEEAGALHPLLGPLLVPDCIVDMDFEEADGWHLISLGIGGSTGLAVCVDGCRRRIRRWTPLGYTGESLMICICNLHDLSHLLLIYICKLHWITPLAWGTQTSPMPATWAAGCTPRPAGSRRCWSALVGCSSVWRPSARR